MVSVRRLLHNRMELLLVFVVPIAFFSIFALIFGGGVGGGSTPNIKVVAVDTVQNDLSRRVIAKLHETAGLHFVRDDAEPTPAIGATSETLRQPRPLTTAQATELVRQGNAAMAIVIRPVHAVAGQADAAQTGAVQPETVQPETVRAELLSDSSDQVAPQVVSALVMRALMTSAAESRATRVGLETGTPTAIRHDDAQAKPVDAVTIVDVLGENKSNPVVTMYAAGIAVMFLLFGATGGGGALLEERENQTLDRLLTTGLTMDELLLGKWIYLTALGVVQTTLMFAWGQLVFGIDLLGHFDGFLIMTLVTASAAAALGLLLATCCKTRGQLNGLSVVVVLTMSALGGSMVPRYVMSQSLRDVGLWTFNAWALDGYDKVFWRDMPVAQLWPQMSVLMVCGALFLVAARLLAIRWETE